MPDNASTPIALGWPAAQFDLPGIDGRRHSLATARGPNGLVVMFICNHCPYVKAAIERIVRDAAALEALGIGTIAIMSNDATAYPADSFDNMKAFAGAHGISFPYVVDESMQATDHIAPTLSALTVARLQWSPKTAACAATTLPRRS